jgi:hypothetical protein
VILALCAATLAVAAHAAGGSGVPHDLPMFLLTVLIAGAGVALAAGHATVPRTVAALGASQVLMHVMFALTDITHIHGSLNATVVIAQTSAVLLVSVLLVNAETAINLLSDLWRAIVPITITTPVPPERPLWIVPARERVGTPRLLLLGHASSRRGPPVCS